MLFTLLIDGMQETMEVNPSIVFVDIPMESIVYRLIRSMSG